MCKIHSKLSIMCRFFELLILPVIAAFFVLQPIYILVICESRNADKYLITIHFDLSFSF